MDKKFRGLSMQTLLSTMNKSNQEISELIRQLHIKEAVVINQITKNCSNVNINNDNFIESNKVITICESGLSKSRNRAIDNAVADICLIADDDIIYEENYDKLVIDAFERNPSISVICFYVERNSECAKKQIGKRKQLNRLGILEVISVQIAFRLFDVKNRKINFDENFGAGSKKFNNGEENIFLNDCLDNHLKILYLPIKIATIPESTSTWFNGFDEKFFMSKGALFFRLWENKSILLFYTFAIIKYKEYKKNISLIKAIKYMNKGKLEYQNNIGVN